MLIDANLARAINIGARNLDNIFDRRSDRGVLGAARLDHPIAIKGRFGKDLGGIAHRIDRNRGRIRAAEVGEDLLRSGNESGAFGGDLIDRGQRQFRCPGKNRRRIL